MESIFEPKPAHPSDDQPQDAGKAFLLSVLYPGLGHWLIGKTTQAIWISAFFTLSLGLFVAMVMSGATAGLETFGSLGLRAGIFLYGFALIDSYFTAQDINRGDDPWVDKKPRTAAVLNLLTNGFGYFYLGSRFKGLAFMVIGNVLARTINASGQKALALGLVVEGLQAALAWDAWRLASRMRREDLERASDYIRPVGAPSKLPAAVPVAAAGFVAFCYIGLAVLGSSVTTINQSQARFIDLPDGVAYDNPAYGIFLKLPELWTFEELGYDALARFSSGDFVCSGGLTMDSGGSTPASLVDDIITQLGGVGPVESLFRYEEMRASGPSISMEVRAQFTDGGAIRYWATVYGKGPVLYTLYVIAPESLASACEAEVQSFRTNFYFTDL